MAKGYILAEVEVTDPALFETYRPLAAASIAAFGGRYLVRGGATEVLEGEGKAARMVLLEFSSPERAMEWYRSVEYQKAVAIRLKAASSEVRLGAVEGGEGRCDAGGSPSPQPWSASRPKPARGGGVMVIKLCGC
jgi:uncharacterized protein (DUF1330 family)